MPAIRMLMAQISKPPVTIKLYRHFAVVTIVMAATLAFLTGGDDTGENSMPGAAAPASASSARSTPVPAGTPAYGQAQLVTAGGGGGSFGSEAGPGSGGSGGGMGRDTGPINPSDLPPPNSENAGFTSAYLNSLSDEELEDLLRALREGGITSDSDRRDASAVLEAASRRRSGQRISQQ